MLGNFSYCNPTKLYFGDESLKYLNDELPKFRDERGSSDHEPAHPSEDRSCVRG